MRLPKYRKNSDGRAFVEHRGKRYYLGKFGSAQSHDRYRAFIAKLDETRPLPSNFRPTALAEVCELYLKHVQAKFGVKSTSTSTVDYMIRYLLEIFRNAKIDSFGPRRATEYQSYLVAKGMSRSWCNDLVDSLKRMFRWAAQNEYVNPSAYHAVSCVEGIRKGDPRVTETAPVKPVPWEHVEAVLPFVNRQVAAIIQVQYFCGMRPSEAAQMRGDGIDRSGPIWLYTIAGHKTDRFGNVLVKAVPRVAQRVIQPFLDEGKTGYLFSPLDARNERWKSGHKRKRQLIANRNPYYSATSYYNAIQYGIKAAARKEIIIPHWHPNQLRHAVATLIRQEIGQQSASIWLGHSKLDTTTIYAERQTKELLAVAELLDRRWT